ncbi:MAG: hypothetical protein QG646_3041 [Euryarchaeota archaeon]|nr:hypothetical protein [Euryarchaeota archaeon]
MPDLAWLPSSVMQTVGALYTIFVAVFIIQIQYLYNEKNERENTETEGIIDQKIAFYERMFIGLAYFVVIVEAFCGIFIYYISEPEPGLKSLSLFVVYFLFVGFVIYIVVFSSSLISELTGSAKFKLEHYTDNPLSDIKPQNFIPKNFYIFLIFMTVAFHYFLLTINLIETYAIIFSIIFFIVVYYALFKMK